MLPTSSSTIKDTGREAVKRDFYNLDSLIGELATPKEQINNARPGFSGPQSTTDGAPGSHPEFISGSTEYPEGQPEPMAPEIAAISGRAIAGTIDTVLSTGLSLYAKAPSPEKYEASDKQIQKLSEAWAAVAAKYNYRVEDSPWLHIIALNAGIYIPKFNEAKNDRRFAEMDQKLETMQKLIEENENRLKVVEAQNNPKPAA